MGTIVITRWQSFLAAPDATDERLERACREVLGVAPQRIKLIDSIDEMPAADDTCWDLIIERRPARGEFPVDVTLYLRKSIVPDDAELARELLTRICRATGSDCLVEDGWVDPYSMHRIRPTGAIEAVDLDPDRLDADESFVIKRVRETTLPPSTEAPNARAAS